MADMKNGPLGGFTGTLGGLVGYYIRGKHCVRSRPKKHQAPASPLQIIQRERFKLMMDFLKPLACFINDVHKGHFKSMNGYNKIFSLNIQEAISGDPPEGKIDFQKLQLSRGCLQPAGRMKVSCGGPGFLVFSWSDDSNRMNARSDDPLFVTVLFQPTESRFRTASMPE